MTTRTQGSISELRQRVEAKRKKLESEVAQAKADATGTMNEAVRRAQTKLDELKDTLQSGWDNLSEKSIEKINQWLKEN